MNTTYRYWQNLREEFVDYAAKEITTEKNLKNFKRSMELLANFAFAKDYAEYSPEIGYAFIKDEETKPYKGKTSMERRKTTIRKLNEYLYGNKCWQRTPRSLRTHRSSHEPLKCPEQFREVFEEFLESLKREGLKDVTLEMYRSFCIRHLLSNFAEQGIADWCDIDVKALTSAFSDTTSKVTFATYARRLFGYLLKNGIVSADYSSILPMVTKRKVLPSVYSEEEIQRLLDTIETITPQGKRDYTMVLIAARLGLRVSDIARLCFENVDFDRAIVKFVQYKTSVPHQLPLPVEVENALLDYIGNGREESDEPYIFLDGHGRPMANHTIGHIGARHLKNSGVEIGERKGGMHALRSSFASQLVADKVPYDVVRYALGHVHPNSTRHYVQFAVESLRACALEVPLPSGLFKKYLEGGM